MKGDQTSRQHEYAMDLFEKALCCKDTEVARLLFNQAFELEMLVAAHFAWDTSDPTRGVLLRSAASIAFHASKFNVACQLARIALRGEVSNEIADELDELQAESRAHTSDRSAAFFVGPDISDSVGLILRRLTILTATSHMVAKKSQLTKTHPYKEGASYTHLRNDIATYHDREGRPAITYLRTGSPGFMVVEAAADAIRMVLDLFDASRENWPTRLNLYGEIHLDFSRKGLLGKDAPESYDVITSAETRTLISEAPEKLATLLSPLDVLKIMPSDPLLASKIMMSIWRCVHEIRGLEPERVIMF